MNASLPAWDSAGEYSRGFDQFLESMLPSLDDSAFEAKAAEFPACEGDITGTISERKESGERKRARNNLAQKRHRDRKRVGFDKPTLLQGPSLLTRVACTAGAITAARGSVCSFHSRA